MKAERIVLSLIAIFIGLFVAGVVFYFFQMTRQKPPEKKQVTSILPTPTTQAKFSLLTIDTPKDESVSDSKSIKVSGTTEAKTIVISTENDQDVVTPDENKKYTTNVELNKGVNLIRITAITDDGKEESQTLTISYEEENF